MKARRITQKDYLIIAVIAGASVLLAGLIIADGLHISFNSSSGTSSTDSPSSIPTSVPEAKAYISEASEQAGRGDYAAAKKTLETAIKLFPDDQNLKLTLEYYENQAPQNNR